MERELWGRVTGLFDAALEYPPSERRSFLERACEGDDALLAEVVNLVAQFERAGDFLERPLLSTGQALAIGEVINGRYRIETLLGRGGMGEVYRAHDGLIDEKVALKTLRLDADDKPEFFRRFRREVQLARKVTHPSVCRVFEFGKYTASGGREVTFFTMQLLEGETLSARIRNSGPLPMEVSRTLALQIAEGLDAAHAVGVIHRDFKSANVMLCAERAVIMDFGLARVSAGESPGGDRAGNTTVGMQVAGTIAYMSPEQLSGGVVTTATDIYSFGVVLFEMLTGRLPFDDRHIIRSAMERASDGAPNVRALAPEVDGHLAAVIARCLQRDAARRYARAHDVWASLQARYRPPMVYWTRRQWAKAALAAVSLSGVALVPVAFRFNARDHVLPEGAEILLGPIANLTTDERLDAITELFRNQLAQSVRVNLVDGNRIATVLRQMNIANDAAVEPAAVREAAWRLEVPLSVYGTVARIGPDYVFNVQLETRGGEPQSPRTKTLRSFSAADPTALMRSVRDASNWIREAVGESAENIGSYDRLPADTTTSSWEALTYFARGQRLYMINDWEQANLQFEAALREDPEFTLAAMRRADILMSQNRQTAGIAQWRAAIGMLDKRPVTRAEELYGRGMFAFDSGDMPAAERYAYTWSTEYPHDWRAPYFRALPLCLSGHPEQAVEILEPLRQVVPEYGDLYVQLIGCYLVLGEPERARALIPLVRRLSRPERADLREAHVRYWEGDCVGCLEVLRAVQRSSYRPAVVDAMLQEGLLLIDAGYLTEAAANIERFLRAGSWIETVPGEMSLRVAQAWAEMLDGKHAAAVEHARMAFGLESGPLIVALAGTVFARCGAIDLANAALQVTAPFQDIQSYKVARHRITGELERASGDAAAALEEFRAAAQDEPAIAHRQYLIEALPRDDNERLDLAKKAAERPWQGLRPPVMQHIGAMRTVVADLTAAGVANRFVNAFAKTSKELASHI